MISAGPLSQLIAASCQLSIAAAAVWLIARRLSGNARAWLWRAVAVKTCVAFFFIAPLAWLAADSSDLPLGQTPTPGSEAGSDHMWRPSPDGRKLAHSSRTSTQDRGFDTDEAGIDHMWRPSPDGRTPANSARTSAPVPGFDVNTACLLTWAAGLGAGLGILTVRMQRGERFIRKVAAATPAETLGRHRIVRTNSVGAPLILGFWRPTILLPADSNSPLPLAHELAHADRNDLRWEVGLCVFRALFWFHPLAWLAAYEHRQACEEASDALAIERTGADPTDYGRALLAYASQPMLPMTALASSATTLRRRIQQMHRRLPHPALIGAIILASVASLIPARLVASGIEPGVPSAPSIDERASSLITRKEVRSDIGLSDSQMARIQKAWDANYTDIGRIGGTIAKMKEDGVPVKTRIDWENKEKAAWSAKNAKDALAVLSPSQRTRMRQIALQATGPMALGEPAIGQEAGLSAEKIGRIAAIAAEAQKASMRLSVQKAHEEMERFRSGVNLPAAQRSQYLSLVRKNEHIWKAAEFKKVTASFKLAADDPKRIQARKDFDSWMAKSPNRLSPEEDRAYFDLSKLAGKDPTRQARDRRYARFYRDMFARYNVQCLRSLSTDEQRRWRKMLGRILLGG